MDEIETTQSIHPNSRILQRLYRFHIFVSYQSADFRASTALTHSLQEKGLRIWLDRDTGDRAQDPRSPDDNRGKLIEGKPVAVREVLESAVNWSMMMAVLTSPTTLESAWVRTEIQIGLVMRTPMFFVHLADPGDTPQVRVRRSGTAWDGTPESLERMADLYQPSYQATAAATEFMRELSEHRDLNIVAQLITDLAELNDVCDQLNQLIELSELIVNRRETVSAISIREHWRDYASLCSQADELINLINDKFGRKITVRRLPYTNAFRLKRPFVQQRVAHLKRLLEDEAFRASEFRNLGPEWGTT
jgi:hypothetical protein